MTAAHDHQHEGHDHHAPRHAPEHDHDHGHSHGSGGHHHAPASFGLAFATGTGLNTVFVAAQILFGIWAHSTALLADAVHNLGDVLGLVVAWGAAALATRHPTDVRTYGWGRSTILASLSNAVVLLFGCGAIAVEAIRRFSDVEPVAGGVVMGVAAAGIVINGATALLFMRGSKDDLNIRGAFLHMASDAVVSAGVVLSGLIISLTSWQWLDPITSLAIVVVILVGTWGLLKDSVNLALDAVPVGIELARVEAALRALPGVVDVHDLHIWGLSTTDTALTAHLVQNDGNTTALLRLAETEIRERFKIRHATFQIETPDLAATCELRPAHII